MMILRRGNRYAKLRDTESILINDKVDCWPPDELLKIENEKERAIKIKEIKRTVFRVESPDFERRRMKLVGNFMRPNGSFEPKIIMAWIDDLIFYKADFDKKKLYRIPPKRLRRTYNNWNVD